MSYFTDDHFPIHAHAYYGGNEYGMKVVLIVNKDTREILERQYLPLRGYEVFKPAQLADLKNLIVEFGSAIVDGWYKNLPDKIKDKTYNTKGASSKKDIIKDIRKKYGNDKKGK